MTFYRRRLPHWQPEGVPIFLTWRLAGSLPLCILSASLTAGQRFAALDRDLDRTTTGPLWLKDERVAGCVATTIFAAERDWRLYDLRAWVIMANHVHLLIQPLQPLSEITRSVKSSSARVANQILNRAGSRFWQVESYDHWVRNQREFDRIKRYIEQNPVKAGLSVRAEDWRWSSAWEAGQVQAGACVTPA
jgi:putative DNA methylase